MENKMTKREVINMMLAEETIKANDIFKDFLEHELELLDRKVASKSNKQTEKQTANEGIKDVILATLETIGKPVTVGELLKVGGDAFGAECSGQKLTSLLTQLRKESKVVRTLEKKVSYYSLPIAEDVEEA